MAGALDGLAAAWDKKALAAPVVVLEDDGRVLSPIEFPVCRGPRLARGAARAPELDKSDCARDASDGAPEKRASRTVFNARQSGIASHGGALSLSCLRFLLFDKQSSVDGEAPDTHKR
jgi:hypothetical protein